ncbi:MAG: hypothetical protein HFJ94_05950 [Muribaculaceae bacterium]|nr:hypothetical protein [Muribaculaceae bacterium]
MYSKRTNRMNAYKLIITAAAAAAAISTGAYTKPAVSGSGTRVERSESSLIVNLAVNLADFSNQTNREVILTPVIKSSTDSLVLQPIIVAGRTRYYRHLRNDSNPAPYTLLRSNRTDTADYTQVVDYAPWMETSELILRYSVEGCCGDNLGENGSTLLATLDFAPRVFVSTYIYVKPEAEAVKTRSVSGSAFIDFKIGKTVIDPDYRNNPRELAEIRASIDEVKSDKDVTITSLSVVGYASPDGSYAGNERLAKGRTQSLVDYVNNLYHFPAGIMHTAWHAEDWEGLVAYLRSSSIENKDAIIELAADNSLAPDTREARLKSRFPKQYAFLLENVFPSLRHSDYKIDFNVRAYVSTEEIAAVMASAPQKLSLEELFRYARSLDENSPEFREVMEVAVRMFPDSPVANLNAASTAVAHGEFDLARAYLAKAGNSPQATYINALLLIQDTQDYPAARALLRTAADAGVAEATAALQQLDDLGF